ncbi:MAG TPA: HRDC domain-containing protein [Anaerolineales bacterium]
MPAEKLPPPTWIATPLSLKKAAGELVSYPRLAVDTEANSLHAYREQLCLIQFSTPLTDYLVDPLSIKDLLALNHIFENPGIEKVFHAVEYDLICLKRDVSINVVNLFDTMQAARILGYQQVGLDSVLSYKLGITLDKKYQKADWGKRPLSPEMLNYARLDTHYLLELRDSFQTELEERGRWELACEEFIRLAQGNGNGKAQIPAWQRVKGGQKCSDRQLTILQELCIWRETQARRMNRPLFRVIEDQSLVAIAQAAPKDHAGLSSIGLTTRQIDIYGDQILQAVERGKEMTPISRPHFPRPNQAYLDRLKILSNWRKTAALKFGTESDIVLPKNWMHLIAEKNPKNMSELVLLMPQSPWRLEQFGKGILKILRKKNSGSSKS